MAGEHSLDHPVIEIRTYHARPGQRERLMGLMRELAFPVQRQLGMQLLGPFPLVDDPEGFMWLRAFPTEASRDELKRAFYEGLDWTGRLEGQLMPLLADYGAVVVEDRQRVWDRWPSEPA